ncbi:MAG: ribosome hibernation-promoting factor, HPF/YfiA family [Myxococcota bacterium]
MQVNVTFRQMEHSDALKQYAEEKIEKLKKFLKPPVDARVTFSVEKYSHIADVAINAGGISINASEKSEDMYSSFDLAYSKIERQIRKYKEKHQNR